VASRQARIHSSTASEFYLRVRSGPIIEHSQALAFGPYTPGYPGADADLAAHGLLDSTNEWQNVQDFGWLRATASPNFKILSKEERKPPPQTRT